jgi:uncharacterized membrane protein YuzA (DUF378 family)
MLSFTVYLICAIIVLIGAINWGVVGTFNIDLVKSLNDYTFKSDIFVRSIYIIVGIAALYMLFNRTYFLPFLGKTVLPPSVLKPYETKSESAKKLTIDVMDCDTAKAKYVMYWGANPGKPKDNKLTGPMEAYGDYSNYGVALVKNNKADLKFECPINYKVNKFGVYPRELPKHLHYRIAYNTGILSEVKTIELEKECK